MIFKKWKRLLCFDIVERKWSNQQYLNWLLDCYAFSMNNFWVVILLEYEMWKLRSINLLYIFWVAPLRYAIAMSFVGRPKDQMLPYIKSMQAASKLANNADLLMVMMKSDSKHMTAT